MNKAEKILIKHYKSVLCDKNGTPAHLREDIYPAMEEYSIRKMIDENLSILEMAKRHMDERSMIVIKDRISELERSLAEYVC